MVENSWKQLKLDRYGWKWIKMDLKLMEMAKMVKLAKIIKMVKIAKSV